MSTLVITKSYADGETLLESDLDNIKNDVETFLNTTRLDSNNLLDNGIETRSINDAAVTTAKINNSAVTTAKINDLAVTTAKIDANAVTDAKIQSGGLTAASIATDAITTAKILNANVTTAKIADANVTAAKVESGANFNGFIKTSSKYVIFSDTNPASPLKILRGTVRIGVGNVGEGWSASITTTSVSNDTLTVTFNNGFNTEPTIVGPQAAGTVVPSTSNFVLTGTTTLAGDIAFIAIGPA